ncbi:MAG: alpha/beta fold hydrolase, partial [Parvularculaceae bacterium]
MREPSFPPARRVEIGDGVGLAAYEMGEARGARPPVVLLHGWPEIARAWRRQLPAIAAAGFRAIAIDLKGFGASDAPHDVAAYSAAAMADDFVGLLNALDIDRAIFCGHDWGGAVVWPMAQRRPARGARALSVSTPPPAGRPPPPARRQRG